MVVYRPGELIRDSVLGYVFLWSGILFGPLIRGFDGIFPHPTDLKRLPFDNHELVGLVAPRGLYIPDNNIDWLDPKGTVLGATAGRNGV